MLISTECVSFCLYNQLFSIGRSLMLICKFFVDEYLSRVIMPDDHRIFEI